MNPPRGRQRDVIPFVCSEGTVLKATPAGEDGEGGLGPSINANPAPQFIKRFQMRHGLGVMPSFKKDEITPKDLHDISMFLHAWKTY